MALRTARVYPIAQQRKIVIHRKHGEDLVQSSSRSSSSAASYATSFDADLQQLHLNVGERIEARGKQKEFMNDLNERLADYIEKVRFLDAQNRRLTRQLEVLRDRYGRETDHVRAIYECEVTNLKRLADQSVEDKARVETDLSKAESDLRAQEVVVTDIIKSNEENQVVKSRLNQTLADMEGEIALLKRKSASFDGIKARTKREVNRLRGEETRLKKDLENTVQNRFKADLEATLISDVFEAVESGHLIKWQELANEAYKDSTSENREAWQSEFKAKLKKIQQTYEDKVVDVTEEVNESLTLKLSQSVGAASREQFEYSMVKQEVSTMSSRFSELSARINTLTFQITQQESEIVELESSLSKIKTSNSQELVELKRTLDERRSDCVRAKQELQQFFDMKLSTEIELAAYNDLLQSSSVSETIEFVDGFKNSEFSLASRIAPRYYSVSLGGYLGGDSESGFFSPSAVSSIRSGGGAAGFSASSGGGASFSSSSQSQSYSSSSRSGFAASSGASASYSASSASRSVLR